MFIFRKLGIVFLLSFSFWGLVAKTTQAVKLADGTVAFAHPPKLLDAITTFRSTRAWGAKYYFTLFLPPQSDEPLQKITVNLRQGADEIDYRLDKTIAAVGTARNKTTEITIAKTTFEPETNAVTIIFADSVPAGTTFTLGLVPKRNPDLDGTYLFGVTAFPAGKKSQGIYLGAGRLQFDRSDGGDFGF